MTKEEEKELKVFDAKQRWELAKALGWTGRKTTWLERILSFGANYVTKSPKGVEYFDHVPKYDLNELYEIEELLTDEQLDKYPFILSHIVDRDTDKPHKRVNCFAYHATARQRREAMLALVKRGI